MLCQSNTAKIFALLSAIGNVCAHTVTTLNGTIDGTRCNTSNAFAFLGIPYALPPMGHRRLAAPEPYNKKYGGVLNATAQPPRCPQFGLYFIEDGKQSEDWYAYK
jgi:carboxylesterase type B